MTKEKLELLSRWVKYYQWEENDARTDAVLNVTVDPSVCNDDTDDDTQKALRSVTKEDIVELTESFIIERIDTFHIDAININMDGDIEDTKIKIHAEIHLSE